MKTLSPTQDWQIALPVCDLYVDSSHAVHELVLANQYVPTPHSTQLENPSPDAWFTGQN